MGGNVARMGDEKYLKYISRKIWREEATWET
jgi:hypothetical protein